MTRGIEEKDGPACEGSARLSVSRWREWGFDHIWVMGEVSRGLLSALPSCCPQQHRSKFWIFKKKKKRYLDSHAKAPDV